jgi:hypothetical protein
LADWRGDRKTTGGGENAVIYYHSTSRKAARAILTAGFRDSTDRYVASKEHTGVWIADRPLDENERARSEVTLKVEIPDTVALDAWEWVEEGKTYRKWLVPAAVLNKHATVTVTRQ